jgi:nitrogen fixation NifU-like protein
MDIYHLEIMDHYQHPRHKGILNDPDFATRQYNPSCGDEVSMQGICQDNRLTQVAFCAKGCVISQAAASMLCAYVCNKTIDEIMNLTKDDMLALIKIPLGPIRLKCALLPLDVLKAGLEAYGGK